MVRTTDPAIVVDAKGHMTTGEQDRDQPREGPYSGFVTATMRLRMQTVAYLIHIAKSVDRHSTWSHRTGVFTLVSNKCFCNPSPHPYRKICGRTFRSVCAFQIWAIYRLLDSLLLYWTETACLLSQDPGLGDLSIYSATFHRAVHTSVAFRLIVFSASISLLATGIIQNRTRLLSLSMPLKSSDIHSPHQGNSSQRSRKRKRHSSPPGTSPSLSPSTMYSSTLDKSMKMFKAVTDSVSSVKETASARKTPKAQESTSRTAYPRLPSTSMPSQDTHSQSGMQHRASAPGSTWKLDRNTGTFVAVVPTVRSTETSRSAPRASISKPHYHRNKQPSEASHSAHPSPSMFSGIIEEGSGTGGSNVGSSLGATEQPFVIQYPIHAGGRNEHSVEKKLSRHARRRAAAAHRWDRDVIPALIRPYMEYMHESQRGQASDVGNHHFYN
ncbi:hypothetical protein BS47DRAFT_1400242 [Hydnum rufescens UP504]|uniref:Uncharacterized protein n=1 Tax=Hydnum rufescens UP504 TaxID=1448309 RepID=A0A9P6DL73_9AGAM|nr:hypothetical protein BS47DRAFT_1400242 [Hydnum rufescens UP504]